jgi:hypothetical protein
VDTVKEREARNTRKSCPGRVETMKRKETMLINTAVRMQVLMLVSLAGKQKKENGEQQIKAARLVKG